MTATLFIDYVRSDWREYLFVLIYMAYIRTTLLLRLNFEYLLCRLQYDHHGICDGISWKEVNWYQVKVCSRINPHHRISYLYQLKHSILLDSISFIFIVETVSIGKLWLHQQIKYYIALNERINFAVEMGQRRSNCLVLLQEIVHNPSELLIWNFLK